MNAKITAVLAAVLVALAGLWALDAARADFPSPAATPSLVAHATLLTCHYIENLPERPQRNRDLLAEYVRAYKNFEKAMTEADQNQYRIEMLPD